MYKKRLEHLVEILKEVQKDKIKRKKFNMRHWINNPDGAPLDIELGVNSSCGTVACALGWAASDPQFNKQGLEYSTRSVTPKIISITYRNNFNLIAAKVFFGITYQQALEIFHPSEYKRPANIAPIRVARRITKLIETGSI